MEICYVCLGHKPTALTVKRNYLRFQARNLPSINVIGIWATIVMTYFTSHHKVSSRVGDSLTGLTVVQRQDYHYLLQGDSTCYHWYLCSLATVYKNTQSWDYGCFHGKAIKRIMTKCFITRTGGVSVNSLVFYQFKEYSFLGFISRFLIVIIINLLSQAQDLSSWLLWVPECAFHVCMPYVYYSNFVNKECKL